MVGWERRIEVVALVELGWVMQMVSHSEGNFFCRLGYLVCLLLQLQDRHARSMFYVRLLKPNAVLIKILYASMCIPIFNPFNP